jgi:hypothetical protein
VTDRAWMLPPASQIGALSEAADAELRARSLTAYRRYEAAVDRPSAYETLRTRDRERRAPESGASTDAGDTLSSILWGSTGPRGGQRDGLVQSAAKSAARAVGSGLGRAILRGALGSILGGASRARR